MRLIRKILFVGLIAMWLMNLTGASIAKPPEVSHEANKKLAQDIGPLVKPVGMIDGAPGAIIFHHWSGFALKDNESHVLRISIERGRPINPTSVRKLLASNRTLDEVENEILPQEENTTYRGHIRLGEFAYQLANITMMFTENNLTLNAEVIEFQNRSSPSNSTATVGLLTVHTASQEGSKKGQGELTINERLNKGSYQVLFDVLH
jgi:hypothetical protein